jgi:carboxynorspermidine decarboxylase
MNDQRTPRFDSEKIPSPCFVLDEDYLIENLELIRFIRKEAGIRILLALKGYAMWSTFPLLQKYLDGATASSLHEALLCADEFHTKAHLCAPVYLENEIEKITDVSSHITFNSVNQFFRYREVAFRKGLQTAIRINPEYSEVATDLYNPCIPGSRLGMTTGELGEVLPEGITGLHFHALCEQNADALENTLVAVEEKFGHHLHHLKWLNIGGGHHFTRKDYDIERFIRVVKNFKKKYKLEIIAEPGEAVGWQTGFLVATVQDIIEANGFKTAMLDVSFSAHMPDTLEMPYKPKIWGALEPTPGLPTYRMGGNTCLSGDFMGDYSFEEPLRPGDRLVLDDMIHYTMVKTTTFNGVPHPSIGIWQQDQTFRLVRSFGYEDYKTRLS